LSCWHAGGRRVSVTLPDDTEPRRFTLLKNSKRKRNQQLPDQDFKSVQHIIKWAGEQAPDSLRVILSYHAAIRSVSLRDDDNVITHLLVAVGEGYSQESVVQALGRASGRGLEELKKMTGGEVVKILTATNIIEAVKASYMLLHSIATGAEDGLDVKALLNHVKHAAECDTNLFSHQRQRNAYRFGKANYKRPLTEDDHPLMKMRTVEPEPQDVDPNYVPPVNLTPLEKALLLAMQHVAEIHSGTFSLEQLRGYSPDVMGAVDQNHRRLIHTFQYVHHFITPTPQAGVYNLAAFGRDVIV
jgi:hypothetical protein